MLIPGGASMVERVKCALSKLFSSLEFGNEFCELTGLASNQFVNHVVAISRQPAATPIKMTAAEEETPEYVFDSRTAVSADRLPVPPSTRWIQIS